MDEFYLMNRHQGRGRLRQFGRLLLYAVALLLAAYLVWGCQEPPTALEAADPGVGAPRPIRW